MPHDVARHMAQHGPDPLLISLLQSIGSWNRHRGDRLLSAGRFHDAVALQREFSGWQGYLDGGDGLLTDLELRR